MVNKYINILVLYLWLFNKCFAYKTLLTIKFDYVIILKGRESVLINIPYNFNVNISDSSKKQACQAYLTRSSFSNCFL